MVECSIAAGMGIECETGLVRTGRLFAGTAGEGWLTSRSRWSMQGCECDEKQDLTQQWTTHSMTMDPDACPWDCKCDEVVVAPLREE